MDMPCQLLPPSHTVAFTSFPFLFLFFSLVNKTTVEKNFPASASKMPDTKVVLLTVLPTEPRLFNDFNSDISNIKIDVFDLTVRDNKDGVFVGSAEGVTQAPWETPIRITPWQNNIPPKLEPAIIQHYKKEYIVPRPPPPQPQYTITPESVATAVVVIKLDPTLHSEFDSLDLRIVVTRGGRKVGTKEHPLEYNVPIKTIPDPLPSDPQSWINRDYNFVSGYIFIPPPPRVSLTRPGVDIGLSADSTTPVFNDLVNAVNRVLADDHSSTDPDTNTSLQTRQRPLDPKQALQVARELVYDRTALPLPRPKKAPEEMYGNPGVSAENDQARKVFEADLQAYYSQHDGEALQLANFVYAAATAMECEKKSLQASEAGLSFSVVTRAPDPAAPFPQRSILLKGFGATTDPNSITFGVPAAFFYALGCGMPTHFNADDRLEAAYVTAEPTIIKALRAAEDNGVMQPRESALSNSTNTFASNVSEEQAARRLVALGAGRRMKEGDMSTTAVQLDDSIKDLVVGWLEFGGPSSMLESFWVDASTTRAAQYLELVLDVIVAEKAALKAEIKSHIGRPIRNAADLPRVTDSAWRAFWMPATGRPQGRVRLLPEYTAPGSPSQRVNAFIRHVKKLFTVTGETLASSAQPGNTVGTFDRGQDVLQMLFDAMPGFSFAQNLDIPAITAVLDRLSLSDEMKDWAIKALQTIAFLQTVTTFAPRMPDAQQFSLMESLYARGFITADRIAVLSRAQFRAALAGTMGYGTHPREPIADQIHALAAPMSTITSDPGPEPGFSFSPINPGDLVNCIPPVHLSPLGPIMYLKTLLGDSLKVRTTTGSSSPREVTLETVLQDRRGPLSTLRASHANVALCIPLIDIANESLEALMGYLQSDSVFRGTVQNTDDRSIEVGGFPLDLERETEMETETERVRQGGELDPEKALLAIPQHSSPHLPNPPADCYQVLQQDFSSPELPYDQELDINRSYLSALGLTRYEVMRAFRKTITEFVLEPSSEPQGFRSHIWRYPVHIDIVIEYLHISQQEYQQLFQSTLHESDVQAMYGYARSSDDWVDSLSSLPVFLARSGLSYCEFHEFWKSRFVDLRAVHRVGEQEIEIPDGFPECEPCCLASFWIGFGSDTEDDPPVEVILYKIIIFVRLWRKVELRYGAGRVSMAVLAAVCDILGLVDENDDVNPDFIRQLVALLMLCDEFGLRLCFSSNEIDPTMRPDQRLPLLSLWADHSMASHQWGTAVRELLNAVEAYYAQQKHTGSTHFTKIVADSLPALSNLVGFTDDITWHEKPTCTLRFAEVLAKINASPFTVTEILFLFTNEVYTLSDDEPFPYTEETESKADPLNVPEDDDTFGLWQLRRNLLDAMVDDEEQVESWSWQKINYSLRKDFGLGSPDSQEIMDSLKALAEHFFPHVFEASFVPSSKKQFRTPLHPDDTNPLMWEASPCEPFHYDTSTSELWVELPLRDEDVLNKLSHVRQLRATASQGRHSEIYVVSQLYFAPRLLLAPFTSIFGSLAEAVDCMVQEPCERRRFAYFQKCFALFHRRCEIVVEHLAAHVEHVVEMCPHTEDSGCGCAAQTRKRAWEVLRRLIADENWPRWQPWERDSGKSPAKSEFTWEPMFSGSAFSALLGLTGTGIHGEFKTLDSERIIWEEIRGPLSAFGDLLNRSNVPVPMVIPALDLVGTEEQRANPRINIRNGFALDNDGNRCADGQGGQGFRVTWKGVLLVDKGGQYQFMVHRPLPEHDQPCDEAKWLLMLGRGQKTWTLINHGFSSEHRAPATQSLPVCLSHGAYDIEVRLEQPTPAPDFAEEPRGIVVCYNGPDTDNQTAVVPLNKLFLKFKDSPLGGPLPVEGENSNRTLFLNKQYVSSLRDIRRTYQRAFKALFFARRFCLSADSCNICDGESELGFFLNHPVNFQGVSYYNPDDEEDDETRDEDAEAPAENETESDTSSYLVHRANFDFNFFPVRDAFWPPTRQQDNRADPSPKRISALFDWWERIFDYRRLRDEVDEGDTCCRPPLWRLFYEAATQGARETGSLVGQLGVDGPVLLVLRYFEDFTVRTSELQDELWAIRVRRAWKMIQRMQDKLYSKSFAEARPDLWAATAPSSSSAVDSDNDDDDSPVPQQTGNQNLMWFVTRSLLVDRDVEQREYCVIKELNDGLRSRANKALRGYLCAMDRVPLPFETSPGGGGGTPTAKDGLGLSALLLQEVDVGLCETATRTDEAITSLQMLIQRQRLGLEPTIALPSGFSDKWDTTFGCFEAYERKTRQKIYSENWIQWEERCMARDSEAFRFLERGLDVHSLAVPTGSPPFVRAGNDGSNDLLLPTTSALSRTQVVELLILNRQTESVDQGIGLLGSPARAAQPSRLTALKTEPTRPETGGEGEGEGSGSSGGGGGGGGEGGRGRGPMFFRTAAADNQRNIPLWFQAAIRLGRAFVRVAAASSPPATWHSWDQEQDQENPPGCYCGKRHDDNPLVDEYYFWLEKGEYFNAANAIQDAGAVVANAPAPAPAPDGEDDTPRQLMHWPKRSLIYLHWTRVHYGEFLPPRRSTEGVPYEPGSETPNLLCKGRQADSLSFTLFATGPRGFRYDIPRDSAVVLPQLVDDTPSALPIPAPLSAYPFFVYFRPGAPIFPVSSFSAALAIAGLLRAQCRFEEALEWCRVAFDPLQRENTWAQCKKNTETETESGEDGEPTSTTRDALAPDTGEGSGSEPRTDEPCCPTSPVQAGIARGRAVVLEYLHILLQWGDMLLCKNTFEARKQALVLFNEAIRLLGPKPPTIQSKTGTGESVSSTIAEFVPASAPLNPKLLHLYGLAYDRRALVQQCLNSQRLDMHLTCKKAAIFQDPSSACCALWDACGCECCGTIRCQEPCCLPYKFSFLLPKALELVNVAKGLGQSLLTAIEKGDAEYISSIRQAHDRQMNELILDNKQNSYRESDWQVQALEQQMDGAQTRLRYNQQLINSGLNAGENVYLFGTAAGMQSRIAANISEAEGQALSLIPDFTVGGAGWAGSPVAINKLPVGSKMSQMFQAAARILNTIADVASTTAGVGSTAGGWARRSDEWQHQVDVITIEIAQIKRQQLAARRRRGIALRELNNHQVQIENSAEVDAFVRDKTSKQDLYLLMQQETAQLYRRTFDLAWQTVKEAEAALRHERRDLGAAALAVLPPELEPLGPTGWESLHAGLMAGEKLEYALRALDRMYLRETGCREYELQKHISLRLDFPVAFLQLKTVGWCEFEIPEWMFDANYPGHYMRRIKNVSVTIPCVVGPYVGVHCRLQLLSSGIRTEPILPTGAKCCCKSGTPCIGPGVEKGKEEERQICETAYADPSALNRDFLISEAIATSSGQNDSGLFELSFRDEKLRAPFEYAGAAASRWRVELPPRNNAFDLSSLSDFVLHLNYTAREGGPALREVADRAAWKRLPGDGVRFFDVRAEFPARWNAAFGRAEDTTCTGSKQSKKKKQQQQDKRGKGHRSFPLIFSRRAFPFMTGRREVTICGMHIFIDTERPDKLGSEHFTASFIPQSRCKDDVKEFEFTASCEQTPGFFHGVLRGIQLGPLRGDESAALGWLEFPKVLSAACVQQAYFLCYYEAAT